MQTNLPEQLLATDNGQRANDIMRSCVHCGFCNATCPTYQITGDELDGPRGRIYLMRELLETGNNPERTTFHLDRCLTCRACETTCPSGVAYGELAEITRNSIGVKRAGLDGHSRTFLQWLIPQAGRLRRMARLGKMFRFAVPKHLARHLPATIGKAWRTPSIDSSASGNPGALSVVLLNGCAQQVSTPNTNIALAGLLQAHGVRVSAVPQEGCCGSLDLHLGDEARALQRIRHNVDVLFAHAEAADAIISSASGCGVTLKDYARLLAHDEAYAARAAAVAAKVRDASEFLNELDVAWTKARSIDRVAWHSPCTLQHGQQCVDVVETLLRNAGYALTPVPDSHLCCGSAGTYSVLQPQLSEHLKTDKWAALMSGQPELVATANVGCQTHLAAGQDVDVVHWVELLK
ncbi:MAG: glycolate oxidase subunit GlcF [bacterium]